jgi:hypothetical protein
LVVADHFDAEAVAAAVGRLPEVQISCRVEAAALFPGGFLILPLVPNFELLHEQRRVSASAGKLAVGRWDHTAPGQWSPHMTCAYALAPEQVGEALAIATRHLPLAGYLTTGGVEDGTTGENWPIAAGWRWPAQLPDPRAQYGSSALLTTLRSERAVHCANLSYRVGRVSEVGGCNVVSPVVESSFD